MLPVAVRRVVHVLAAAAITLTAALPVCAQETAEVGHVRPDGSIEIYKNRLQPRFPDGTPVASVEVKTLDGFSRLYRWAADGCRGESTLLRFSDGLPNEPKRAWILTAHPIDALSCNDRGCEATFTEPGWYTAKCDSLGTYKCLCVKKNLSKDNVIAIFGDYCVRGFSSRIGWDLTEWVLPQFVQ